MTNELLCRGSCSQIHIDCSFEFKPDGGSEIKFRHFRNIVIVENSIHQLTFLLMYQAFGHLLILVQFPLGTHFIWKVVGNVVLATLRVDTASRVIKYIHLVPFKRTWQGARNLTDTSVNKDLFPSPKNCQGNILIH